MKQCILILLSFISLAVSGQDITVLLKEADNFEKQQKEPEALNKYKQVLILEPGNTQALVKTAELNLSIGSRQTNKNEQRLYYETGSAFAQRAWQSDSTSADVNYLIAAVAEKMAATAAENKKAAVWLRDEKYYADKALAINPQHGKAHYLTGKWHYEMVSLPAVKKAAIQLLYGGMPKADMDSAILHLEKGRSLEPYFVANYLVLAKAYKDNHQPAKAIEVLSRLVKLPTRNANDPALKAEGAKLLEAFQ